MPQKSTHKFCGRAEFFTQWLDRQGAPILNLDWSDASTSGRHQADVTIRQIQKGDPYDLQLDVAVESGEGTQLHEVEVTELTTRVTLPAKGRPTDVKLDPHHRLLMWTPDYGDRPAVLLSNAEEARKEE